MLDIRHKNQIMKYQLILKAVHSSIKIRFTNNEQ